MQGLLTTVAELMLAD